MTIGAGGVTFDFPAGMFQWTGGTINTNGNTLTNTGAMTLANANGVVLTGNGSLVNQGTIDDAGAGGLFIGEYAGNNVNPILDNQSGATFAFQSDSGISNSNTAGSFTNEGTLTKTGGTGASTIENTTFINSAAIDVQAGTLALAATSGTSTGGTFDVAQGATLNLTGGNTVNYVGSYSGSGSGTVTLAGGTLAVGTTGASFDFPSGMFQWTGGTINTNGHTLTNTGVMTLSNASGVVLTGSGSLVNQGTIDDAGAGGLYIGEYAGNGVNPILDNQSGATFAFQSDSGISNSNTAGSFTNEGTLTKTGGTGTSTIQNTTFINSAAIDVQTGTLALAATSGTSTGGTFDVAQGATLDLTGGNTVTYAGSYSGSGGGTIALSSGQVNIGTAGATFNFPSGMFQWTGGTINTNGNTLTNIGAMTLANAGNVYLVGNGTLANQGTIDETGAGSLAIGQYAGNGVNPKLDNQSGATFAFQGNGGITNSNTIGTFSNEGTLTKTSGVPGAPGPGTSTIHNTTFINSAAIDVQSGTLALAATSGTSTGGTFDVAQGATLDLTGGNTVSYAGAYTGSGEGTVALSSGQINIAAGGATFDFPAGLFQWTGGTINTNGNTLTNTGFLTLSNSGPVYLVGNGTLANQGTIDETGAGSLAIGQYAGNGVNPKLDNQSGATFDFEGNGGITNSNTPGTFSNEGALAKTGGTGTSAISSVGFSNPGTVEAASGTLTLNSTPPQFSGSTLTGGAWDVLAGATLSVPGAAAITTNDGNVSLSGAGSVFAPINSLSVNNGSFGVLAGRTFTTAGSLSNTGTVTVGGTMDVSGSYIQASTAAFDEQLGGTQAGQFGLMAVTGAATLAGALGVDLTGGYQPAQAATTTFLTANSVSGSFGSVSNITPGSEYAFSAIYTSKTASIVVSAVPFVDLVVTQEQGPSQLVAGLPGSVTWTVTNDGNSATTATWHDDVFLSLDGQIDSSAIPLVNQLEGSPPLGANSSYQASATFTVPVGVSPGSYSLLVDTDYDQAQAESTYSNNVRSVSVPVLAPQPDLVVTGLSVSPSPGLQFGGTMTVHWDDSNSGLGPTFELLHRPGADRQHHDGPDAGHGHRALQCDDPRVLGRGRVRGPAVFVYAAQRRGGAGPLQVTVTNDIYDQVTKFNSNGTPETSSTATTTATSALAPYPDLHVGGLAVNSSSVLQSGGTVTIDWNDSNVGNAAAIGTWYDQVIVSNTTTNQTLVNTSQSYVSNSIAAGGMAARSYSFALPNGTAGVGQLSITVTADAGGSLLEYNAQGEIDTNRSASITAQSTLAGYPYLLPSGVEAPAIAQFGQSVSVTWTVTNDGNAPAQGSWSDQLYLSSQPTLSAGATLLATQSGTAHSPLAVGADYTSTAQVMLPSAAGLTAGTYYLIIVSDANQSVFESGSPGQAASAGISISLPQLPALTVSGLPATTQTIDTGQALSLSWTVTNSGGGAAAAPWTDEVVLSASGTLGSTDNQVLYSLVHAANLPSGQSYQTQASVTIPYGLSGPNTLFVVSDATDAVAQATRAGDFESASLQVVATEPPTDLAVDGVTAPVLAQSGQPITVGWRVTNLGTQTTTATTWSDEVFLSPSATFGSSAISLGTFVHNGALASEGDYVESQSVAIPADLAEAGSYYVFVLTDALHQVSEPGAAANQLGQALNATQVSLAAVPDLAPADVAGPPNAGVGQAIIVTWDDTNAGQAAAVGPWSDALYLSSSGTLSGATLLGTFNVTGSIAAGQQQALSDNVTLPTVADGNYSLVVVANYESQVFERGTPSNNTAVSASTITIGHPDLLINTVTAPPTAQSGGSISVSWTGENAGDFATGTGWVDDVYLTTNGVLSSSAVLLGSVPQTASLGAGQTYQAELNATLPNGIQGGYKVVVETNATGTVNEGLTGAGNDTTASSVMNVSLAPYADLSVGDVTAPPLVIGNPVTITVSWQVTNNGTGPGTTSQWDDRVVLSTSPVFGQGTEIDLGDYPHDGALSVGATYAQTENIQVPPGTTGQFYLFVETDALHQVYQYTNTQPDVGSPSNTVNIIPEPYAALDVSDVTADPTALSGQPINLSWTVANNGIGSTDQVQWSDNVYVSSDPTGATGMQFLESFTHVGALGVGDGYTRDVQVTLPEDLSGTQYLFVETGGPYQFIYTSGNQGRSGPVQVTYVPPPAVNLDVLSVTGPTTAFDSSTALVTWTVENNGPQDATGFWTDSVYLAPDGNFSEAVNLGDFQYTYGLEAGKQYTRTEQVTLP